MKDEDFLKQRALEIERAAERWRAEGQALDRLEQAVELLRLKASRSTKGHGTHTSRKRELLARKEDHSSFAPNVSRKKARIKVSSVTRKGGNRIAGANNASFAYNGSPFLSGLEVNVSFGEKIVLLEIGRAHV